MAEADEIEGVNEILMTIDKFMETYKRYAMGNLIDHTKIVDQINVINLTE